MPENFSLMVSSFALNGMLPMNSVSLSGLVWSPKDLARALARSLKLPWSLSWRALAKSRLILRPSISASFFASYAFLASAAFLNST